MAATIPKAVRRIRRIHGGTIVLLALLHAAGCQGTSSSASGTAFVLSVTPGSLSFTGQAGGANPASQSMSVTNAGGVSPVWAASSDATWLSVTPAVGMAPFTVSVSVNLSGLVGGSFNGTVTIASTGDSGSAKSIPVTLTVTAPPPAAWPQISLAGVAGGFSQPVQVTHAGDGSGRIFVVEQAGRIRVLDNGVVLPSPFLDISSKLICCGEQGLLSVAFPPGFAAKGYFYVNYTRTPDAATVVARYSVSSGDANGADPASEEVILTIPQPFANPNGGQLAFGPDGYLYIGKLLRIDVESTFEEIDFQPAGGAGGHALPVFVYDHAPGCSVTGGHVYRGAASPPLQGVYLFGDFCSGRIWGIRKNGAGWDNALLATTTFPISTFGEDESGNVYVVNHASGDLLVIR